jgi:hypothetical protein
VGTPVEEYEDRVFGVIANSNQPVQKQRGINTFLSAVFQAALLALLSGVLWIPLVIAYLIVLVSAQWFPDGKTIVPFLALTFAFSATMLFMGFICGKLSPRWGWLLALGSTVYGVSVVYNSATWKQAAFLPIAAVMGWAIAAYKSKGHLLTTFSYLGLALVILLLASGGLGWSDRQWFLKEAVERARIVGADIQGTPEFMVADIKFFPSPSPVHVGAIWKLAPNNTDALQESVIVWFLPNELRRRQADHMKIMRVINYMDKNPTDVSEAKRICLKYRISEQFLSGLKPIGKVSRDDPDWIYLDEGGYMAGPDIGTWKKPRVLITPYGLRVLVGWRLT